MVRSPLRWFLWAGILLLTPSPVWSSGFTISGATVTLASPLVLSTSGDVTLSNGSLIANGALLQVGGNWSQTNGSFVAGASTVTFQGASTSTTTLTGSSTFYSLQCVTSGKGLTLQAGSTQTVTGPLILMGGSGNLIQVRSSVPGSYAYLVNSGTNTVGFVNPQDNSASGGLAIRAGVHSTDGGHNTNWSFGEPAPSAPTLSAVYVSSLTLQWGAVHSLSGYSLEASTASDFTGTIFSSVTVSTGANVLTVGTASPLTPDTTYYVRVGALYNGTTSYASMTPSSTSTLTSPISGAQFAGTFVTSVTVNWAALGAAQGYVLDISTSSDFTSLTGSSITTSVNVTTLTVNNLAAFTTYYLRIGGLNWDGVADYAALGSTRTTPGGPPGTPNLSAVFISSIPVTWTAASNNTGYELDASTASNFTGTILSSVTVSTAATGLTVGTAPSLASDTTYYLRAGALYNGATTYAAGFLSTATLTSSITGAQIASVFTTSVTVNWMPLASAQSYDLEASTSPDFNPIAASSTSSNVILSTLTVSGLTSNIHYFFRVGGLNWNAVPNFTPAGSATAGIGVSPGNPTVSTVFVTSITATWETVSNAMGYEVDASTAGDFTGTIFSSVAFNTTAATLTVGTAVPLAADTTYYLRIGALYNGATSFIDAVPASTTTLTTPIAGAQIAQIFANSVTVNWPVLNSAQGYKLDASTAADFTGAVSSSTTNINLSTLTVSGLTAGTTYFFHVGGLNWNDVANFSGAISTRTPAGPAPINPTITAVIVTSITVTWGSVNSDNGYSLEASTASTFTGAIFSSVTINGTLTTLQVSGLGPNTTYYLRVGSLWNGTTNYADTVPASALTLAVLTTGTPTRPFEITGSFAGLGGSFIVSWRAVTLNTSGQPTPIGYYTVERSADLMGPYAGIAMVDASTVSYTDITNSQTFYYRVKAADVNNNFSAPSDILDSSPQINRYVLAAEDPQTRLVIPATINVELLAGNNAYGDITIQLAHQPQNESGDVLFSYQITAARAATGDPLPNFAFSQTQMIFQMHCPGVSGGALHLGAASASSNALVTPYWLNGPLAIALSNPVAASNQPLSVTARNMGDYQVRLAQSVGEFELLPGSPYPRILTPNRPDNRRLFFFFANPSGQPVTASIYDMRGAKVRDLSADGLAPTTNSLVWDGRNTQGNIVPSGVYVYKLQAGGHALTGTVVVAR